MDNTPNNPEPTQPAPQWQPAPTPAPAKTSIFQRVTRVEWAVLVVIALVLSCTSCGIGRGMASAGGDSSQQTGGTTTQSATHAPATATHAPVWTTVQNFKGNGIKTTDTFSVPATWKLTWTCDPHSFYGGSYNVAVTLYDSGGNMVDLPVNTICKAGNTGDTTTEHTDPGQYYLNVNSEAAWTIKIQVQK
ncbi:MAG TPA: hypothetical protein VFQ25_00525 [Ktedonobacterales bacterium]|nr:hypothetical protein [Ktedonobacterales bacterium]